MEMKAAGMLESNTALKNPNFAAMAHATGVLGIRVEKAEELEAALRRAFLHSGPALVDVVTNRNELVMPPTINVDQISGFSLWLAKAVLSGRGDEVIDLAASNVLR
jgi:pyruvate dehydrogenase (quinone)